MQARQVDALIIEDELELQDAMKTTLGIHGLSAEVVQSTEAADAWLENHWARVILLDLSLPGRSGLEWLQAGSPGRHIGVIVITGRPGGEARLQARDLGADDYLRKPLDLDEVALTVRNLLNRLPGSKAWQLDLLNWQLLHPSGKACTLTAMELGFMHALALEPGRPVARRAILRHLDVNRMNYDFRRMEVMVRRLRHKLDEQLGDATPVQTARGVGYSFAGPIEILSRPAPVIERPAYSGSDNGAV